MENGTKGSKAYKPEDVMFISLHADSEPGSSGTGVCYDPGFSDDTRLATILNDNFNNDEWISASKSERKWGDGGLQVLHQSEKVPSVLVEVEYVNGSKSQNLDSSAFQTRFEDRLIAGINEYFGIGQR